MKIAKKPLLLISFLIVSAVYTYAHMYDVKWLKFWSKPFLIPLLAFYYISVAKIIDAKFLIALFFAFCGDLFFLGSREFYFVLNDMFFNISIIEHDYYYKKNWRDKIGYFLFNYSTFYFNLYGRNINLFWGCWSNESAIYYIC